MSNADPTHNPFAAIIAPYGPYAFGAIILLTIWYSIVTPTMDRQADLYVNNEKIVGQLREAAINQTTQAASLERTSAIQEKTVSSMNILVEKMTILVEKLQTLNGK